MTNSNNYLTFDVRLVGIKAQLRMLELEFA